MAITEEQLFVADITNQVWSAEKGSLLTARSKVKDAVQMLAETHGTAHVKEVANQLRNGQWPDGRGKWRATLSHAAAYIDVGFRDRPKQQSVGWDKLRRMATSMLIERFLKEQHAFPEYVDVAKEVAKQYADDGVKPLEGASAINPFSGLPYVDCPIKKNNPLFFNSEPVMDNSSEAIIKIETKTYVNLGSGPFNAENLTDDQIFQAIQRAEGAIEELGKIKNRPLAMEARIAELEAGIQALVSLSNERHKAAAEAKK